MGNHLSRVYFFGIENDIISIIFINFVICLFRNEGVIYRETNYHSVINCFSSMPPKKGGKASSSKSSAGGAKKEVKGGTSVKVRHILCEKQVTLSLINNF